MIIYQIINIINRKKLIGQTITKPNVRWNSHLRTLRKNIHNNSHFQNAYNKYGEKSFIFEVIDNSAKSRDELDNLEIKYIQQMNTLNPKFGYNKLSGGHSYTVSDDVKKKHSRRMKHLYNSGWKHPMLGKHHKLNSRLLMSKTRKKFYKTHQHHSLGISLSDKHRKQIKDAWVKEYPIYLKSPTGHIVSFTKSTRDFCREWEEQTGEYLDRRGIDRIITGQYPSYKHWTLVKSI